MCVPSTILRRILSSIHIHFVTGRHPHRAVRPSEVVIKVGQVGLVRAKQLVKVGVRVVLLQSRNRLALPGQRLSRRRGRVCRVPVGEEVMERLEVIGVVSDAFVEGVPRLIEVSGTQPLEVPQSVKKKVGIGKTGSGKELSYEKNTPLPPKKPLHMI